MNPKTEFYYLVLQAMQEFDIDKSFLVEELELSKTRDWAIDLAIPPLYLGFEYEGIFAARKGQSGKSRHLTPTGYSDDCEKYGVLNAARWAIIRITPIMISDGRAGPLIRMAIEKALQVQQELIQIGLKLGPLG